MEHITKTIKVTINEGVRDCEKCPLYGEAYCKNIFQFLTAGQDCNTTYIEIKNYYD